MEFESQAVVRTEDGLDVGHLERVVLDPESKEVTHVVLGKGMLEEEKVIPLGLVGAGSEDVVTIRGEASELEHLLPFEEKHIVGVGPSASSHTSTPASPIFPGAGYGQPVVPLEPLSEPASRSVVEVTRNIPQGTVPLKIGAKVIASDGRTVGRLERVLTDGATDQATDLVVARGFLTKSRRRIPLDWVRRVGESRVDLDVGSRTFEEAREVAR
jgi:sporulation protein YlmC with PRC-barrel domain